MANIINADNGVVSGISGIRQSADATGNLAFQSNGVTLMTLATNNTVTFAGQTTLSNSVTATSFTPTSSTAPTNGVYLPAANTLGFSANSIAAMKITPSGAVATPYQPAFLATGSGGSITITPSSDIPYNQLVTSFVGSTRNSGYNTSTYQYTAPIAGLYYFYAQIYVSSSGFSLAWWKNGSQMVYQDVAMWSYASGATGITQITGGAMIVELAAGDYISTRVRTGEPNVSVYMGHSCFFGYLIG